MSKLFVPNRRCRRFLPFVLFISLSIFSLGLSFHRSLCESHTCLTSSFVISRFFWNPGSQGLDAFLRNGPEKIISLSAYLPYFELFLRMRNCKTSGSLINPLFHSVLLKAMFCRDFIVSINL